MKIAVILVGPHYSGKSKTIIKYVKPLLGIAGRVRVFVFRGAKGKVYSQSREEAQRRSGLIRSQSLEERGYSHTELEKFVVANAHFERLVLAARPADETGSLLKALTSILKRHHYRVFYVRIKPNSPERFYVGRAREVLRHLGA